MSEKWSTAKAIKKLKEISEVKICDALLDQQIFSGVGNIIKNEVLWRVKLHPETIVENITPAQLKKLMREVVVYSFEFLKYRKEGTLAKHWKAYNQKLCSRCKNKIVKRRLSINFTDVKQKPLEKTGHQSATADGVEIAPDVAERSLGTGSNNLASALADGVTLCCQPKQAGHQ